VRWRREIHVSTEFHLGNLKESDHLEDLGIGGKLLLKWML
jgi:hypothetical protein